MLRGILLGDISLSKNDNSEIPLDGQPEIYYSLVSEAWRQDEFIWLSVEFS